MNVKAYQLDEAENGWRGYLYDKDSDSEVVKKFFPDGVLTTKKEDRETVKEARDEAQTVITSNETDYIRFTLEAPEPEHLPKM